MENGQIILMCAADRKADGQGPIYPRGRGGEASLNSTFVPDAVRVTTYSPCGTFRWSSGPSVGGSVRVNLLFA